MPEVGVELQGDLTLIRELSSREARLGAEAFVVVRRFGFLLQGRIQRVLGVHKGERHTPRPPGLAPDSPRQVTGDYARSWSTLMSVRGGDPTAEIGTNAPQGRRLEFGFVGVDAIGRHYNQPPYPHARPALNSIADEFTAAIAKLGEFPTGVPQ